MLLQLASLLRVTVALWFIRPLVMLSEEDALCCREVRAQTLFITAIPAARRFSPDDVVQDVEPLTHHDLNVCRQAVTGEKIKTASRFKHSPELCEAHIKPAKIILIPFPLIVPAVGFHFEVRRIRDYQVNGVIRESGDVLQAISVD